MKIVDVQFDAIERAMGALPVGGIHTEVIHQCVHGVAHHEHIVGIAQMPVEIDPVRQYLGAIDGKTRRHGHVPASFSRSRVCAGVKICAPMASIIVRALLTSCALLAYTPRLKYRLSSSPTRTLPPRSTDCATHGICIRLMAKEDQTQSAGRVFTIASR